MEAGIADGASHHPVGGLRGGGRRERVVLVRWRRRQRSPSTPGNDRLKGTPDADQISALAATIAFARSPGGLAYDAVDLGPGRDARRSARGTTPLWAARGMTSSWVMTATTDRRRRQRRRVRAATATTGSLATRAPIACSATPATTPVKGFQGNDFIVGGAGDDTLQGDVPATASAAAIAIFGGPGNDAVEGGDGNDRLHGGDGNDQVNGNAGNDRCRAQRRRRPGWRRRQ